jgi:hypothetical protein
VVLWLACARAGLIHVPVNFALTGDELLYILNQSGARALFYDPALREAVDATRDRTKAEISETIHGGEGGTDLLAMARERAPRVPMAHTGRLHCMPLNACTGYVQRTAVFFDRRFLYDGNLSESPAKERSHGHRKPR